MTLQVDRDVKEMAVQMQDTQLVAKLAAREMVAVEAKYHCECLHINVSTRHMLEAAVKPKPAPMTDDSTADADTFAELTSGKSHRESRGRF